MRNPAKLQETIQSGKRLLIFLHDNPDPDAIASGWILQRISEHLGVHSKLLYCGQLGRAENRAMVKLLKIPLQLYQPSRNQLRKTDRFALVDTQPGTGNNSFPENLTPHIVIDHHPLKTGRRADYSDIRHEEGSCTTMLLYYHKQLGLSLDSDLATAAAYAIISETQDLEREATKSDRETYHQLFPLIHLNTLGKIRHPPRERHYYRTIARAMRRVLVGKHTVICHIGPIPYPDVVAEVADFFVAMERITWCLVSGLYDGSIIISLRTTQPNGQAHRVIKMTLDGLGKGGGHSVMAGGIVPLQAGDSYEARARMLSERFLSGLSRRVTEHLRPLLEAKKEEAAAAGVDGEIISRAKQS